MPTCAANVDAIGVAALSLDTGRARSVAPLTDDVHRGGDAAPPFDAAARGTCGTVICRGASANEVGSMLALLQLYLSFELADGVDRAGRGALPLDCGARATCGTVICRIASFTDVRIASSICSFELANDPHVLVSVASIWVFFGTSTIGFAALPE